MAYEIRLIGPGDSTTSGRIDMSEAEARALFEADAKTLEPGSRIELSDYETGAIIEERAG